MKKPSTIAIALAALGTSAVALANPYYDDDGRSAYAQVLSSAPIYREVSVAEPHQECYQQQVVYNDGPAYGGGGNVAGVVLGGLVGGVVGNRFGGGSGRVLATAAGAVVGASVGNNLSRRYDEPQRVGYQERCNVVNDYHTEQRIDGYDVTYRYGGRVYHTRLPYDPGARLAVNVDVAPASW